MLIFRRLSVSNGSQMLTPTDIEKIVLQYLINHRISFQFQTSLSGGFFELGGAVIAFLVEPNLAWRVMGEYWHRGVQKSGSDIIQKENLTAMGYVVIDLWGDDLQSRLEETMRKALLGQEML